MMLFFRFCRREILIRYRQPRDLLFSLLFFMMACLFFPLALPANPQQLQQVAPGLIWFCLTFSMLLSAGQLWQRDYEQGLMTQWFLMQLPLGQIIQAKIAIHWITTTLPVLIMLPFIALTYALSGRQVVVLLAAITAGSISITYLTAFATVFSLTMQQKGTIVSLIVLPLILPVLILGSGVVIVAAQPVNVLPYLALLSAGSIFSLTILPWPIAAIIRLQICETN